MDAADSTPSYISTLASPMRMRHKDSLLVTTPKVIKSSHSSDYSIVLKDDYYNAWKEDMAVVNIFFGKDTVMGEISLSPSLNLGLQRRTFEWDQWQ